MLISFVARIQVEHVFHRPCPSLGEIVEAHEYLTRFQVGSEICISIFVHFMLAARRWTAKYFDSSVARRRHMLIILQKWRQHAHEILEDRSLKLVVLRDLPPRRHATRRIGRPLRRGVL